MNPIEIIRLIGLGEKFKAVTRKKGTFMTKFLQFMHLAATLAGVIGVPAWGQSWLAQPAHSVIFVVLVGASVLLHAISPSIFGGPSEDAQKAASAAKLGVILLLLMLPVVGRAQTAGQVTQAMTPAATTTVTFTGGSDVIALRYGGAWGTGNLTTESYDLIDFGAKKTEHLFLEGKELIGAQAGINAYTGGVKFQPDLAKVLAKTNVSPANFGMYFSASGGAGTLSTGGAHGAVMLGGGIEYRSSSALSWNPLQMQYVRIGSQNAAVISTGLSFIFGQK